VIITTEDKEKRNIDLVEQIRDRCLDRRRAAAPTARTYALPAAATTYQIGRCSTDADLTPREAVMNQCEFMQRLMTK